MAEPSANPDLEYPEESMDFNSVADVLINIRGQEIQQYLIDFEGTFGREPTVREVAAFLAALLDPQPQEWDDNDGWEDPRPFASGQNYHIDPLSDEWGQAPLDIMDDARAQWDTNVTLLSNEGWQYVVQVYDRETWAAMTRLQQFMGAGANLQTVGEYYQLARTIVEYMRQFGIAGLAARQDLIAVARMLRFEEN